MGTTATGQIMHDANNRVFYPVTVSDLVKDPNTGRTVMESITNLSESIADPWAPSKVYSVADLIQVGGKLYRCKTIHTSANTFDSDITNWETTTIWKEIKAMCIAIDD